MSSRPPSTPPRLEGYEVVSVLGTGGYADVYLYRQRRPRREVAIKVLLAAADDDAVRRLFEAEANVMAALSTHPSIVTVHQAEIAADGRPCIVMEYCPRPSYGTRFRAERISVSEALRVGVMISGAVETAHRSGILHRDIKPANVLVTEYNRPALTDFGISIATAEGSALEDATGMSIPWSPPEFFADPPRADVRSDVFSLAATVYSLLAGRTPFETPGRRSTAAEMIHRIETQPPAPLDRADAPASLGRVLTVALAADPAGRYDSALAFGRALQQVESELGLPVTPMDVIEDRTRAAPSARHEADEQDAPTRIRALTSIPTGSAPSAHGRRRADRHPAVAPTPRPTPGRRAATTGNESTAPTVVRPRPAAQRAEAETASPVPGAQAERAEGARRRPAWLLFTLVGALVAALALGAVVVTREFFPAPASDPKPTVSTAPVDLGGADRVAAPSGIAIQRIDMPGSAGAVDKARVSWERPSGFTAEDSYVVRWTQLQSGYETYAQPRTVRGRESTVMDAPPHHDRLCVQVAVQTPSGASDAVAEQCE